MNIEKAIKLAINYETKVRDLYVEAANHATNPQGKKIFTTMAKEEQGHLDYLNSRLEKWEKTGELDSPDLGTVVPSMKLIQEGVEKLQKGMDRQASDEELDYLQKALEVEQETSTFYRNVVNELPQEGKKLFTRFMEIEEGHLAIVQAEIDALTGSGFWFDFGDINLEMG
ncbi:MAG: ferritin family protein [Planctomycetota bacterium]|jgi:rubrerythrin